MGQRFGVVRSSRRAHNPETGSSNLPGATNYSSSLPTLPIITESLIMIVFTSVVAAAAGDVVVLLELGLINAQSTYGRLQKAPPIVPNMTIVANVSKSLFGAPKETPNTGIRKVRYATGINCFRLGSQQFNFLEPYFTKKADTSGMPITVINAPDQWYIIVILYPSEVLPSGI